ncbi:hypothetical protein MHPYR_290072 [uncultured Mycobacterium sp.]|uniref:Uncharacterized protein n=1 Tax=uncultured Mycobacterium sp. TaxID=171292 RepID=A0A1Y5PBA8_9MYCO|nr:hypothetical protein MHPYR_290072 [uncultured Mycobacterium sp.]
MGDQSHNRDGHVNKFSNFLNTVANTHYREFRVILSRAPDR